MNSSMNRVPVFLVAMFFAGLLARPCHAEEIRTIPASVVPYAMCGADLTGDGRPELLVGGLDKGAVCALTSEGAPLWRYDTPGMVLAVETGDLDGDGKPEIAAVVGTSATEIILLDRQGKLLKKIRPEVVVEFLQVADVDGDRKNDIVVAGYMGKILAYDMAGRKTLDTTVIEKDFYRRMIGLQAADFNGDGRVEIAYHGAPLAQGMIDGKGQQIGKKGLLAAHGCVLSDSADIDGDGKPELLFGGTHNVIAENTGGRLWTKKVGETPAQLIAGADGIVKFPSNYGARRFLAAGNFTAEEGLEVATFASTGQFSLLSSAGKELMRTKTRFPFLRIAAADLDGDGFDEALLSRIHYKNVYAVKFADVEKTEAEIKQLMAKDYVTDNLDLILTQIDAIPRKKVRTRNRDEKLHVLWGTHGALAGDKKISLFHKKMRGLANENVEYGFMVTWTEKGASDTVDKRGGICAAKIMPFSPSTEAILQKCRQWERQGIPFYPVVSHAGIPVLKMSTAKEIMEVAPNACQGFITWETIVNYPNGPFYDFLERVDELAQICVKHDKKILMGEEAPFWLAVVYDPKARAILLKPEYKRVLVPVLKTLGPYCDEIDIAAYLGSMLSGEIETWGITSEEDYWPGQLGYYRGCPDDIVMRQEVMATSLGARYIMIESGHTYFELIDALGRPNFLLASDARIARESRRERMVIPLFEKGVVGPVTADDLLSISPVGFRFSKSPKVDKAEFFWAWHGERMFGGEGLMNWTCTNVMLGTGEHSLSRHLYGSQKLMDSLFPANPWGIIPIFGPEVAPVAKERLRLLMQTDGEYAFHEDKQYPARQVIGQIARTVRGEATKLPFLADGGVFFSARRDGEGRYQVFLMDREIFAPVNVVTTVMTGINGLQCHDEITGQRLPMVKNRVSVTVPAGGFRLLAFEAKRR